MTVLSGVAIRLHGPLQAWGGPVVGDDRPSLPFPTRSGVLGLVASCMGIRRPDLSRLLALAEGTRVHIRADLAGSPMIDDQTIQGNPNASTTRQTIQSKRTYLCDASFLAIVVPGPHVSLAEIAAALSAPVFAPYLGRRSCVPSSPLLAASEVHGEDPIELFASIPRGPRELIDHLDRYRELEKVDYYLDVDDHPKRLRRLPVRDDLAGPLPRQWRERWVVHVRGDADTSFNGSFDPMADWPDEESHP